MAIELKVPEVGESISEVQIGEWLKHQGERAEKDEPLVEIESDKATVELPAPIAGVISQVIKGRGEMAKVGEVIGYMEESSGAAASQEVAKDVKQAERQVDSEVRTAPAEIDEGAPQATAPAKQSDIGTAEPPQTAVAGPKQSAARETAPLPEPKRTRPVSTDAKQAVPTAARTAARTPAPSADGDEEIVPMTMIRRKIAERLVQAQHQAALLTTFNEIDMSAVMELRKQQGPAFQERFGVKLGFMSFFVKATIEGLKHAPQLNAEVRGTDIVYKNHYDIGIAIGGGKGLVVPVLRHAERMSFAEIEMAIGELSKRAAENKLKPEDLEGGTFTISNGGVYGSLLSTPIVNPPQSGILGMHAIQERPVAREGQVVIRPMMYVALTYDHRIVDGREAVTFLKRIKEIVENPLRMLLEI